MEEMAVAPKARPMIRMPMAVTVERTTTTARLPAIIST